MRLMKGNGEGEVKGGKGRKGMWGEKTGRGNEKVRKRRETGDEKGREETNAKRDKKEKGRRK